MHKLFIIMLHIKVKEETTQIPNNRREVKLLPIYLVEYCAIIQDDGCVTMEKDG